MQQGPEPRPIAFATVIVVVTSELLVQDPLLRLEWGMTVLLAPLRDSLQRSPEAVGCRSSFHEPLACRGVLAPVDGEAEEVEGARLVGPVVIVALARHPVRPFESYQPGLVRVQRQAVLAESLRQYGHHAARVLLVLE